MCCPFLLAFVMKVQFLIGLLVAVSVTMQAENVPAVKIDTVADGYVVTKWELDGRFTVAHFETFDASRFQKNKPHGAFARYYADSTLYSRATYDHGKKNGLYQEYYPDGQLRVEMTYCQGKLDGELLNYHANGQLKRREQYKMNESQDLSFLISNQAYPPQSSRLVCPTPRTRWTPLLSHWRYSLSVALGI